MWAGDMDVVLSGSDDGDWHHYCLTYDGTDWTLYYDGSAEATATAALSTGSDRRLRIGNWNNEGHLDGSIDEVYVYSSALDPSSVQVLYDAATPRPTVMPRPTHFRQDMLIAHYSFDDGDAVNDHDDFRDGTIIGATARRGRDGSGGGGTP